MVLLPGSQYFCQRSLGSRALTGTLIKAADGCMNIKKTQETSINLLNLYFDYCFHYVQYILYYVYLIYSILLRLTLFRNNKSRFISLESISHTSVFLTDVGNLVVTHKYTFSRKFIIFLPCCYCHCHHLKSPKHGGLMTTDKQHNYHILACFRYTLSKLNIIEPKFTYNFI